MQSDWKIIYTYAHCAQQELQNRVLKKLKGGWAMHCSVHHEQVNGQMKMQG